MFVSINKVRILLGMWYDVNGPQVIPLEGMGGIFQEVGQTTH